MTDRPPERRDPRVARTLAFRILVAANRLARPFDARHGAALDLRLPDWRCMMALAAEPGLSGEAVARMMAMDKMAVSRSLARLAAQGRVEARADPSHARRRRWSLSEAGWTVVDRILPDALDRDRAAFGDLPEHERDRLLAILDRLGDDGGGSSGA